MSEDESEDSFTINDIYFKKAGIAQIPHGIKGEIQNSSQLIIIQSIDIICIITTEGLFITKFSNLLQQSISTCQQGLHIHTQCIHNAYTHIHTQCIHIHTYKHTYTHLYSL